MITTYTNKKFEPKVNGFHFVNNFENALYSGIFGWSIRTSGRCGGMSYAALDYFLSKKNEVPDTKEMPADGDVLGDYILKRQLNTFSSVGDEFISATLLPGVADIYYGRCFPPAGESYKFFINQIKSVNRPCNIGCIPVASGIQDIGNGHQVLGIGVTEDPNPQKVLIHLYDSNHPNAEMVLKLNEKDKLWELRTYENGTVGEVRRTFKAWFPDPGYKFLEPNIFANHSPYIDKSYEDLRNWKTPAKQDLQNYVFVGTNFSGNKVDSCDFQKVDAHTAFFMGTSAMSCDFREADLTSANFINANLRNSTFDCAHMENTFMNQTELSDANFKETMLAHAHFVQAKMNNTCMRSANVEDGLFFNLSAVNSNFDKANLEDTNFHAAAMNNVSMNETVLTNAQFLNASLKNCKFNDAKLRNANFSNIPIASCSFRDAYMYRAKFNNGVLNTVDFRDSDLRRADFRGASLDHIKFSEKTKWENSLWQGARLRNVSGIFPPMLNYLISQGADFG